MAAPQTLVLAGVRHVLTPWFDASTRPRRPGVYQRDEPAGRYGCWDGARWRAGAASPAAAAAAVEVSATSARWRGLTEAADAPCATCRGHGLLDAGVTEDGSTDLIDECPDC